MHSALWKCSLQPNSLNRILQCIHWSSPLIPSTHHHKHSSFSEEEEEKKMKKNVPSVLLPDYVSICASLFALKSTRSAGFQGSLAHAPILLFSVPQPPIDQVGRIVTPRSVSARRSKIRFFDQNKKAELDGMQCSALASTRLSWSIVWYTECLAHQRPTFITCSSFKPFCTSSWVLLESVSFWCSRKASRVLLRAYSLKL